MISRTITFGAQSAPVAAATSGSTARRAPSDPTLYRLPCAAPQAALSSTLPRNPWSTVPAGKLRESLATSGDMFWHSGLRPQRRRLGVSGDESAIQIQHFRTFFSTNDHSSSNSSTGSSTSTSVAERSGNSATFFYPRRDSVARDAEGTRQSTQTAAFIIGAQDRFALRRAVGVAARLFAAPASAVTAQVALAAIGS